MSPSTTTTTLLQQEYHHLHYIIDYSTIKNSTENKWHRQTTVLILILILMLHQWQQATGINIMFHILKKIKKGTLNIYME